MRSQSQEKGLDQHHARCCKKGALPTMLDVVLIIGVVLGQSDKIFPTISQLLIASYGRELQDTGVSLAVPLPAHDVGSQVTATLLPCYLATVLPSFCPHAPSLPL